MVNWNQRGFGLSSEVIDQPKEVNTEWLCRTTCSGANNSGLLVSGQSCIAAHFANGKCRIAISHRAFGNRDDTNNGTLYELDYICSSSQYPGG